MAVHGGEPLSKPPLITICALVDGVTAFDGAETGPVPTGLAAVTVNV